jgi:hypothetical protein
LKKTGYNYMEYDLIMENISFVELNEKDFELMHKWLNTDFVKKWVCGFISPNITLYAMLLKLVDKIV